jgi:hypothetical protein
MKRETLHEDAGQRGEGKLSGIIWLVALGTIAFATWNVAPVYMANYSLVDKMSEIARLPRHNKDEKLQEMLWKQGVVEFGLQMYLPQGSFKISTYDQGRTITCEYDREAEVLPGWKKVFHFENKVEQPLIY